ncbi:TPA: hypothetical protein KRM61_000160 [Clostridioides difficile]|nr:hypothetical protein [Clostridioides difficile]HBH1806551.1 hypothetical protein [Clostridioides difficile]HEK4894167.1 hypothetical protein [Clostridioides difficile]
MENKQYIITERAHFMCPNMHFGIKAKIATMYDISKVRHTLDLLANAHPFLKSLIKIENTTRKLFYEYFSETQIPIIEKEDCNLWDKDYRTLTECGWNVFCECLLKVIVYPGESGFEILFVAHHLLGDGRSILGLMCEFADCYASGNNPSYTDEQLIRSIHDLPIGTDLSLISKIIINKANRDWLKEKHTVNYMEYVRFEKRFYHNNPTSYEIETLEPEKVNGLLNLCREHGISLNDYLVAEMMCKEQTDRVVIAIDIRKELACYHRGALGNYATAIGIENTFKSNNVIQKAEEVAKQIRRNLNNVQKKMMILACYFRLHPELIDAAAISTMGDFKSKAGKFIGSLILGYEKRNGYSVTNLGNVENSNIEEAMFIPPASPANKKTMGVLSVNQRMKKCTVCYDNFSD